MARQRDYRAEYARRKAAGAARGLRPSDAAGQRRRSQAAAQRIAERARARADRARTRAARRRPTKREGQAIGDVGRVVESSSPATIMAALRDGAARGDRVVVYVTFQTPQGPRVHPAGSPGKKGYNRFAPEGPKASSPRPVKAVRLVFFGKAGGGGGLDPNDVLALIEREGSTWKAMRHLFDEGTTE